MGSNDMRNAEHYPDPTAGKAIKNADRKKKRRKRLTYTLGEMEAFKQARVLFR